MYPWLKELPKIWDFPFNISATAEASDFKFGEQLEFANSHHKITPRGKSGGALGLGELLKMLRFPYNISVMAGVATSNLACSWGFPRPMIKSHADERVGMALGWGAPQNLGVPFNIFTMAETSDFKLGTQLGFLKAHHRITPRGKSGCSLGLGSSPKFWGSL